MNNYNVFLHTYVSCFKESVHKFARNGLYLITITEIEFTFKTTRHYFVNTRQYINDGRHNAYSRERARTIRQTAEMHGGCGENWKNGEKDETTNEYTNKRMKRGERERKRKSETAWSRKRRRIAWIIRTCEQYSRSIVRGEEGSHSVSSHFHGVAVTEIKMVAGAYSYHHTVDWPLTSLHHIWPPRVHHESVHARTYCTVSYIKHTLRACTCTAAQVAVPHVDRFERIDRSVL